MKITDEFVLFWSGTFSQWFASEFTIDGEKFTSAEQYMMYKKALLFGDEDVAYAIMRTNNPREQKAFGRSVRGFNAHTWVQHCKQYVYEANLAKFTQNPEMYKELMETGEREMVEASPYDKIWGIGLHYSDERALDKNQWEGTNWLGEAIMKVRDNLKGRAEGEIYFGNLSNMVLTKETEEEQDEEFTRIGKEWGNKGYAITSGKISEGKVDELWAIKN